MGSSVACFPSYWFWSLAMALITNQLCTNCRFYHLIFYNQFLKVCELKTGSNTHWYIIITPVTFESKCKCSGKYIFQSRLSNWILKNRATDKGAAICLCAHENMSWNYSACYKSWNVINTSDVQSILKHFVPTSFLCEKYFTVFQLHTAATDRRKSQILNQPTEKSVFLPADLSNDARIQEHHLSITFECGLSASSLRAERSFIFGTISTCWELTHGKKI